MKEELKRVEDEVDGRAETSSPCSRRGARRRGRREKSLVPQDTGGGGGALRALAPAIWISRLFGLAPLSIVTGRDASGASVRQAVATRGAAVLAVVVGALLLGTRVWEVQLAVRAMHKRSRWGTTVSRLLHQASSLLHNVTCAVWGLWSRGRIVAAVNTLHHLVLTAGGSGGSSSGGKGDRRARCAWHERSNTRYGEADSSQSSVFCTRGDHGGTSYATRAHVDVGGCVHQVCARGDAGERIARRGLMLGCCQLGAIAALTAITTAVDASLFSDIYHTIGDNTTGVWGWRLVGLALVAGFVLDAATLTAAVLLWADAAYLVAWLLEDLNAALGAQGDQRGAQRGDQRGPRGAALRHEAICDAADGVAAAFGPFVPTVVTASLCGATSALYTALCDWQKQPGAQVLGAAAWSAHSATFALQLAHAGAYAAHQANCTPTLVHQVIRHTNDEEVKEEMSHLSLQLMHRKVLFTACGLFPIDFTLLYSMVGAVTTFLVILVQFQNPGDEGGVHNSTYVPITSTIINNTTTF